MYSSNHQLNEVNMIAQTEEQQFAWTVFNEINEALQRDLSMYLLWGKFIPDCFMQTLRENMIHCATAVDLQKSAFLEMLYDHNAKVKK